MSTTVTLTLTDLHARNVAPKPHEAVAIVLSLVGHTPSASAVNHDTTRFELPSAATICLSGDGTVSTQNPTGRLGPADVATLLQQILDETPGVPPGLLYSIARALRAVEAPPFESTDAFLRALTRFERGDRRDVVRGLVARFEGAPAPQPPPPGARVERRRTPVLVTDLRKELRAIDRRKYEEQEVARVVVPIPLPSRLRGGAARVVRVSIAVGFAAALAFLTAGDTPRLAVAAPNAPAPPLAALAAPPAPLQASAFLVANAPKTSTRSWPARADGTSATSRRGSAPARTAAPAKKDSHVRVIFRFGWMKHLIEIHSS